MRQRPAATCSDPACRDWLTTDLARCEFTLGADPREAGTRVCPRSRHTGCWCFCSMSAESPPNALQHSDHGSLSGDRHRTVPRPFGDPGPKTLSNARLRAAARPAFQLASIHGPEGSAGLSYWTHCQCINATHRCLGLQSCPPGKRARWRLARRSNTGIHPLRMAIPLPTSPSGSRLAYRCQPQQIVRHGSRD